MPGKEKEVCQFVLISPACLYGEFQGKRPVSLTKRIGNVFGDSRWIKLLFQGVFVELFKFILSVIAAG
ncbi:MAG TPA: hypothetical protein PK614_04960 [Nitrospira sp.]|nr:hypothetical protein [Nitrospira sp.]